MSAWRNKTQDALKTGWEYLLTFGQVPCDKPYCRVKFSAALTLCHMKKLILIILSLATIGCGSETNQVPIKIIVGPRADVNVIVPNMSKKDLVEVISTFFSKGDEKSKVRFDSVIGKASEVTLTLTTKIE